MAAPLGFSTAIMRARPMEAELTGEQKPVAWRYRYTDPLSGKPVWRYDNRLWNGQRPSERQALFAHPAPQPSGPVEALPEDDEPKTWQELAEAAIADLRRYANDETPERRLVSVEAYEERAARLSALTAGKPDWDSLDSEAFEAAKAALIENGLNDYGIREALRAAAPYMAAGKPEQAVQSGYSLGIKACVDELKRLRDSYPGKSDHALTITVRKALSEAVQQIASLPAALTAGGGDE